MSNSLHRRDVDQLQVHGDYGGYPVYPYEADGIDLRNYSRVLIKRKWLILAVLMSVIAAVALQTFRATPIYRSTAKVRIDPEASNVLPYKDVMGVPESYLVTETYLRTQYEILRSRALAQGVIATLRLDDDPIFNTAPTGGIFTQTISSVRSFVSAVFSVGSASDLEESEEVRRIDRFVASLDVNPVRQSRIVEVSYHSHVPEFSTRVVNALVEEFIDMNFESKYDATVRATEFLQKEMEGLKVKVERSEEELTRYARRHGILNIDERENVVVQKLADLNQEMTRVQTALIARTAHYSMVEAATVENFPQNLKNQAIIGLEEQLFQLEQDLASLSSRFGPKWPEIMKTRDEVSKVEEQLLQEKESTIREARFQYQVARKHHQMLGEALEQQKRLANQLNEDSIQYNILAREVETNKQLYEGLLRRLKEAGVSAGLKSSNIQVVDRGEVPHRIFRPRRALNLALGLVIGLMLGVGMALVIERLDNTLKTPDQVEALLAIPSLGVIPRIPKSTETAVNGGLLSGASAVTELMEPAETEEIAQKEAVQDGLFLPEARRIWEAYRSLRTSLILSASGGQPKSILVTSSFTGEGKTTTATNVSIVFAQTGARTLLVDMDMRKPMLARLFGISGNGGMSTFLSGNSDLASNIRQVSVPNLSVLPAGPVPPNPAELIGSERMVEALKILKRHFKYIVIDSSPILSVTDPVVISAKVDGVVLVIQGGKTPRDAVRKAGDHLQAVGGKILGALINNVDTESSEYSYYYRHYYDYGYPGHREPNG